MTPDQIQLTDRFDEIIPLDLCREIRERVAEQGTNLQALYMTGSVRSAATLAVLGPRTLLAVLLKDGTVLLSLVERRFLTRCLSGRWPIFLPVVCRTVQEAVLHLTPFQREDYDAGRWPSEDIAAKVRWVIAQSTGVSFATVTSEKRIDQLT